MASPVVGGSVAVVGGGVVGERIRRNLTLAHPIVPADIGATVVVLATPAPQAPLAVPYLRAGTHVVSTSGGLDDVRDLLELDGMARQHGATLVVGASTCPGLSGLIARTLVKSVARCDEIHVAVHGTAGPACAREHHRALAGVSIAWHDGRWVERRGGSGRELCWFPEPVGARDCYRGELADPVLLQRAFPHVGRITARVSATRRDRLTSRLPMLSPPHAEGGIGALRIEVRGQDDAGGRLTVVRGIAELVGTATAAVATAMAVALVRRGRQGGVLTTADGELPSDVALRDVVRYGVRLQEFTGVPEAVSVAGSL